MGMKAYRYQNMMRNPWLEHVKPSNPCCAAGKPLCEHKGEAFDWEPCGPGCDQREDNGCCYCCGEESCDCTERCGDNFSCKRHCPRHDHVSASEFDGPDYLEITKERAEAELF
jgi:hypothetical protein